MKTETRTLMYNIKIIGGGILIIVLTYLLLYLVFLKQY